MTDPAAIERRDEEPPRRWEDRCDFIRMIGTLQPDLICDRPRGHKGMHTGRLIANHQVVGYGRLR